MEHFYSLRILFTINKILTNLHSTFYINIDDESGQNVPEQKIAEPGDGLHFSRLSPRLLRIVITTSATESRATLQ